MAHLPWFESASFTSWVVTGEYAKCKDKLAQGNTVLPAPRPGRKPHPVIE